MEQCFVERMKEFVRQAGSIALRLIEEDTASLKSDTSVLTQADMDISRLAGEFFKDLKDEKEHIFIDEEDGLGGSLYKSSTLDAKYIWALDPIDGTRNYANRIPTYGISLGVLKNLKPWLGVVYLPALKELYYSDGKDAFFVENAFTDSAKEHVIAPAEETITRKSIFYGNDIFFKHFEWDFTLCQITLPSCAVVDLCWPAVGRGCGCVFSASLWDFAGSWPICRAAGLELRSLANGTVLDEIGLGLFKGSKLYPWKLKDMYILSTSENFSILQSRIVPKKKNT